MAEVRRQEFVVSLADIAANPTKVLAANEFLYVRQADGKLKMMCGDGVTAISALPYTIDIGAMEQAVIDAETAQGKAEEARDDAESHAEQTALDRAATGADRTAVNVSLTGFAETTLPDAIQAVGDKGNEQVSRVNIAGDTQVARVEAVLEDIVIVGKTAPDFGLWLQEV